MEAADMAMAVDEVETAATKGVSAARGVQGVRQEVMGGRGNTRGQT